VPLLAVVAPCKPAIDQSSGAFVVVVPAPWDDEEGVALGGDRVVPVAAQEMIRIFLSLLWKVAADPLALSRLPSSPAGAAAAGAQRRGRKGKMRGRCRGEKRGGENLGRFWMRGPAARWLVETARRTRKRRRSESQVRKCPDEFPGE